jgi:hypothetical protein
VPHVPRTGPVGLPDVRLPEVRPEPVPDLWTRADCAAITPNSTRNPTAQYGYRPGQRHGPTNSSGSVPAPEARAAGPGRTHIHHGVHDPPSAVRPATNRSRVASHRPRDKSDPGWWDALLPLAAKGVIFASL